MRLSIITINRNNAKGLEKTLQSVLAQTNSDFEYVVVDGASMDESVEVTKRFAERFGERMKWISEPDLGIYNAMNKGVEIALGKRCVKDDHTSYITPNKAIQSDCESYIQILNSGDILAAPDVTERMIAALMHHTSIHNTFIPILYGNMIRDFGNGKFSRDIAKGNGENAADKPHEVEWTMYDFIKGTVNHDPTYIHRSLYEKYGLYDESLRITSDWKWFMNVVVFGGEKLYYVPIDVTIFDTTGVSETNLVVREKERRTELERILPSAILKDYDNYHFPIEQYKRLKKHHLWKLVYFMERVLFKLEKWHILR